MNGQVNFLERIPFFVFHMFTFRLDRTDSSGLRFYLGKERRLNEIGTLTFGTTPDPLAIFIPPGMDRFVIDSYCPTQATEKLPTTGITVVNVLPHAHLQGKNRIESF